MKSTCAFTAAAFLFAASAINGCAARTPGPASVILALGQQGRIGSVMLRPVKVLEDSRCPVDAVCVWAGRLRVNAVLTSAGKSRTIEFASDKWDDAVAEGVSLLGACPAQHRDGTIAPGDYRFVFVAGGTDPARSITGC